ncbi:ABC transporter substrate-binding protein [Streptomyces sp. 4N509B]|uniref:ABC transporter substrate-binding protein n=1 Tax=Streptomyces sp. 4N509B TaxID=3457413 RepID=UPI003FD468C3
MSERARAGGRTLRLPPYLSRRAVLAMGGGLAVAACSSGGGGGGENLEGNGPEELKGILFGTEEQSRGPAPAVEGGRPGGTIFMMNQVAPEHLDPAQIYVSHEMMHAKLYHRGLTGVQLDNQGNYTVVGDLATDSGRTSEDGRTWTFTLKDNILWEDGSPITSADVRHTVERMFADFVAQGPKYLQGWLAGDAANYRDLLPGGPYNGDHLPDSVLETPDEKTIIFHFEQPQLDLPYCLAMAGYAVVSQAHDTNPDTGQEKYDQTPLCSGPYRIDAHEPGKSMVLVRNEHWQADTDPLRNAYPDRWEMSYGHSPEDSTARLMADRGDDQYAVNFSDGLDGNNGPGVIEDPQYQDRLLDGYQSYVWLLAINQDRVTDKRIREAICHALPLTGIRNAYGGALGGEFAGGMISPLLPGYQEGYDPYGKLAKPEGDREKARQLLEEADAVGYELNFYHHNGTEDQQYGPAIEAALEDVGFRVNRTQGPSETYYDEIGVVENGLDIYRSSWGHDWLSSSTIIPPLFDSRQIEDGAATYAHLRDDHVDSEIDRISAIADPEEQATEWFNLNKHILEEILPVVPAFYYRMILLHGSKVGGAVFNDDLSSIDPTKVFVTDA